MAPVTKAAQITLVSLVQGFILSLGGMSCTNGSANNPAQGTNSAQATTPASETSAPKAGATVTPQAQTPRAPAASTSFKTFPAISLDGLTPYQKAAFTQLANEEICPCDCPKSWGACLQIDTRCQPAVLLAEWTIGQLAAGVEAEIIAEQITEEIGGFSARAQPVVTQGYAHKGSSQPKYTIVEYADFECAHCKMASEVVSELTKKHRAHVQVVFKHFPLSFHPMARTAALATEAAAEQGKFWEMHDAVFATQTMLDDNLLKGHARALGLDVTRFEKDMASAPIAARVDAARAEGEALGVEATPTFLINGRPFNLMRTLEAFELRFAMEDARATSSCQ